jgi:tetratricopeptide (TPR) repeat protein
MRRARTCRSWRGRSHRIRLAITAIGRPLDDALQRHAHWNIEADAVRRNRIEKPFRIDLVDSTPAAWVAKGDSKRAITDFTQAIEFGPSYVEAYNNRGLSHEVLGRRAEAIADFRKAQSIDPDDRVSKQQLRVFGF